MLAMAKQVNRWLTYSNLAHHICDHGRLVQVLWDDALGDPFCRFLVMRRNRHNM